MMLLAAGTVWAEGKPIINPVVPPDENLHQAEITRDGEHQTLRVKEVVHQLLEDEDREGGIGEQVRVIAREQNQIQEQIETKVQKLDERKGVVKKFFGADSAAVEDLEEQMEQNQEQIESLEELQENVQNQAEESQVQTLLSALNEQQTALADKIEAEKNTGFFGWLRRLFRR